MVVVDSCLDPDGRPGALRYLESIGLEPAQSIALIVATHWHDDHIRGMARLVELCPGAQFCCASALCDEEFLTLVGALEGRHFSATGSGLREIHGVFSQLGKIGKMPIHALANCVVFRKGGCTHHMVSVARRRVIPEIPSVCGRIDPRSRREQETDTKLLTQRDHGRAVGGMQWKFAPSRCGFGEKRLGSDSQ